MQKAKRLKGRFQIFFFLELCQASVAHPSWTHCRGTSPPPPIPSLRMHITNAMVDGIPPLDSLYVYHSVIVTLVSPLLVVFGQIWNGIYPVHRQYRRFETIPRDNKVSIHVRGGDYHRMCTCGVLGDDFLGGVCMLVIFVLFGYGACYVHV